VECCCFFLALLLLLLLLPVLVALVPAHKGATSEMGATHTGNFNSRVLQEISLRVGEKRATALGSFVEKDVYRYGIL